MRYRKGGDRERVMFATSQYIRFYPVFRTPESALIQVFQAIVRTFAVGMQL